MCFVDLGKLYLVLYNNSGLFYVFLLELIFATVPCASKIDAAYKNGEKWLQTKLYETVKHTVTISKFQINLYNFGLWTLLKS
jgi:hypothetical protein